MRNTLRRKQNPYLFLKIGEERERLRRVCVWTLCHLRRFRQRRQWIVTKDWGKTEKGFCLFFCFIFFFFFKLPHFRKTRDFRDWDKSLANCQGHPPKHFKPKDLKKISKCFSQLEVSLARESRAEPQKSLYTPSNWTFYSRTSCQNQPASSRL